MTERTLLKRIIIDPEILFGKPVIKGTRLPVELIIEKLAYGNDIQSILNDYPFLKETDIRAALLYAANSLANEEVFVA